MLFSHYVRSGEVTVRLYPNRVFCRANLYATLLQLRDQCAHMSRIAAGDDEIATGNCSSNHERAGLNAIGNNAMLGAAKLSHAPHADRGRPRAFDFCTHLVE